MSRRLLAVGIVALFAGCNVMFPGIDPPPGDDGPSVTEPGPASLKRFSSEDEFRTYFADQVLATNSHFGQAVPGRSFDDEDSAGLSAEPAPGDGAGADAGGPVAVPPTGESQNARNQSSSTIKLKTCLTNKNSR